MSDDWFSDLEEFRPPGSTIQYDTEVEDVESQSAPSDDAPRYMITLRELAMMRFMNTITDEADWHQKAFDDEFIKRWKQEALASYVDFTESMADWCMEELRYKAKIFELTGTVNIYDADVIKSDTTVPQSVRKALKEAVRPLENVKSSEQDWHPGSDGNVLDLVHPSLFPLIYGRSRVVHPNAPMCLEGCIEMSGSGKVLNISRVVGSHVTEGWSKKFQWLPCEVDISSDEPEITSYINNLHPRHHGDLYAIIQKIIACAIPLWNETSTPQIHRCDRRRVRYAFAQRWCTPDPQEGEGEEEYSERLRQWRDISPVVQPDVDRFTPFQFPPGMLDEDGKLQEQYRMDLKQDSPESCIQVIVKLENIHLSPERPEYEGRTWHVEGTLNERIIATALYYYDSDNISPSSLSFRHVVGIDEAQELQCEEHYHNWLPDVFGCDLEGPPVQFIGSIRTNEGRFITFPNILQHKIESFKLVDPTKPGHQKILTLFLVDPLTKGISTAWVPCQRLDWWQDAIKEKKTLLNKLPLELQIYIFNLVDDFPISMKDAKDLRLELIAERKNFELEFEDALNGTGFALCDHY